RRARRARADAAERPARAARRGAEEDGAVRRGAGARPDRPQPARPRARLDADAAFGRRQRRAPVRRMETRQSRVAIWKFGNLGIWKSGRGIRKSVSRSAGLQACGPGGGQMKLAVVAAGLLIAAPVLAQQQTPSTDPHAGHAMEMQQAPQGSGAQGGTPADATRNPNLPPTGDVQGADKNAWAKAQLSASPRHGDW